MPEVNKTKDQNRQYTLIQIDSDRFEWKSFIDAVQKLGYKEVDDFRLSPGGNTAAMFKANVANNDKVKKLREKFRISSLGLESKNNTLYKPLLAEGSLVKLQNGETGTILEGKFGDSGYKIKLTESGDCVYRNPHEIKEVSEPYNDQMSPDYDTRESEVDDYFEQEREVNRNLNDLSLDEVIIEAMDFSAKKPDTKTYDTYSDWSGQVKQAYPGAEFKVSDISVYAYDAQGQEVGRWEDLHNAGWVKNVQELELAESSFKQEDNDMFLEDSNHQDFFDRSPEMYSGGKSDRDGAGREKTIKPYEEVNVGDMAYENPDAGGEWDNPLGKVLWKGTYENLLNSKYKNTATDWEDLEDLKESEYDLIVINTDGFDGGPTLFNYNNDPSGCVVFENNSLTEGIEDWDAIERNTDYEAELAGVQDPKDFEMTNDTIDLNELNDAELEGLADQNGCFVDGKSRDQIIDELNCYCNISQEELDEFLREFRGLSLDEAVGSALEEGTKLADFNFSPTIDFRYQEGIQNYAPQTEEYEELDRLDEDEWVEYVETMAHYGVTVEYDTVEDEFVITGMQDGNDEEEFLPESTERYPINEEDKTVIESVVKNTGFKLLECRGKLKSSNQPNKLEILVESKDGLKETVVYNDDDLKKPWSIGQYQFNLITEALATVKAKGLIKETVNMNKQKEIDKVRREAYKTDPRFITKEEKERRAKRSQELLEQFVPKDRKNKLF